MSGLEDMSAEEVLHRVAETLKRDNEWRHRHLGETTEEQNKTLRLFKNLTPSDVRDALREYKERRAKA